MRSNANNSDLSWNGSHDDGSALELHDTPQIGQTSDSGPGGNLHGVSASPTGPQEPTASDDTGRGTPYHFDFMDDMDMYPHHQIPAPISAGPSHGTRPSLVKVRGMSPRHSGQGWVSGSNTAARVVGMVLLFVMVMAMVFAACAYDAITTRLNTSSMEVPVLNANGSQTISYDPIDPNGGRPLDILVLGQDTREGEGNSNIGGHDPADTENHQADTAMIVHVSANRDRVDVVSLPRDSIVNQPECATTKGTAPARSNVMLNSTFAYGWSQGGDLASAVSCELATVNSMTGLDITQSIVVDFAGLANMIDAIGGVDICVPSNVLDANTNLDLKAGMNRMDGVTATQYARVRHGVEGADGSDLMRTVRQQSVIRALLKESLVNGTLSNPSRLYSLGLSALDSLNISTGLASVPTLTGLAYSMRNLDVRNIQTMTVPTMAWPQDPNRVVWTDEAGAVWDAIREDKPLGPSAGPNDDAGTSTGAGTVNGPGTDGAATGEPPVDGGDGQPSDSGTDDGDAHGFVMDGTTGLLVNHDTGEMVDPTTGGTVDPATGYIHDARTGGIVGLADGYVNMRICKVE